MIRVGWIIALLAVCVVFLVVAAATNVLGAFVVLLVLLCSMCWGRRVLGWCLLGIGSLGTALTLVTGPLISGGSADSYNARSNLEEHWGFQLSIAANPVETARNGVEGLDEFSKYLRITDPSRLEAYRQDEKRKLGEAEKALALEQTRVDQERRDFESAIAAFEIRRRHTEAVLFGFGGAVGAILLWVTRPSDSRSRSKIEHVALNEYGVVVIDRITGQERIVVVAAASPEEAAESAGLYGVVGPVMPVHRPAL